VIDAQWTGTRPLGYHLTNVALHAAASVLVLGLLLRLGLGELSAFWAALCFAAHPVQVGSVAWIPGRNDVIMSGFALGACLLLLRAGERPGLAPKFGHLLCFTAALFSKETALALPLLFVALAWAIAPERELWRRRWLWIGWACALALYLTARFAVIGPEHGLGIERIQTAWQRSAVLLSDLGKLLFPVRLRVLSAPEDVLAWPGLVAIAGVAALVWLVRGLRVRIMLLAAAFTLVPLVTGLLGAKVVVLENRLYLAAVGTSILAGEVLRAVRAGGGRYARTWLAGATAVLVVLASVGLGYCPSFRDRERFSRAAIEGSPHSGLAAHLISRNLGGRPPLTAVPSSDADNRLP
jgi:hypothetical protein